MLGLCLDGDAATAPRIIQVAPSPRSSDNVLVPKLTVDSDAAITNRILYSTNVNGGNWSVLTNVLVTQTPYFMLDVQAPSDRMRFYRVQALFPSPLPSAVVIPAGAFTMGDSLGTNYADQLPSHNCYVSAFLIDVNLVTKALWDDVYQWALLHDYDFENAGTGKDTNHPVVEVSWYDAVKWCNARSEKEGLIPAYYTDSNQTGVLRSGRVNLDSGSVKWNAGYRLPTEAEWEKAARGGAAGHAYPWRDTNLFYHDRANVLNNPMFGSGEFPRTSPVGHFASNGYGLADMAGNVWEWCWDWYDAGWYSVTPTVSDTRGPNSGDYRTLRGGSWNDGESYAHCATRGFDAAEASFNAYGFRCVKGH